MTVIFSVDPEGFRDRYQVQLKTWRDWRLVSTTNDLQSAKETANRQARDYNKPTRVVDLRPQKDTP